MADSGAFRSTDRKSSGSVRFAHVALVAVLSPALSQAGLSCERTGDTRLIGLEVEALGEDRISGFDSQRRVYKISIQADVVTVRAQAASPSARLRYSYRAADGAVQSGVIGIGNGEATVDVHVGTGHLRIDVQDNAAYRNYVVDVERIPGEVFPCSESGILDAIAKGEGPHTFDCDGPTVITPSQQIAIDNNVILEGDGNFILNGNESFRVLMVPRDVTAEVRGFTITGGAGSSGGGAYNGGTLTLVRTAFVGNSATNGGGGIYNGSELFLFDCVVADNSTTFYGGGIYQLPDRSLTVVRTILIGNQAERGGAGIYNWAGELTVTDSDISSNEAEFGGAIFQTGSASASLTRVVVSGNVSRWRAGGLYIEDGEFLLSGSAIHGNMAATLGGGIYVGSNDIGELATILNTTIEGNTADEDGGGVYVNGGEIAFDGSLVAGNFAKGDGGGIYIRFPRFVAFENTTITGNTAAGNGGGIRSSADMEFSHTTVAGNAAVAGGETATALLLESLSTLHLHNSIVLGSCIRCSPLVCGSPPVVTASGVNIEDEGMSCLPRPSNEERPDLISATSEELALEPLADNGGPTPSLALGLGSIAIDAVPEGACDLDADQRGIARPQGATCDVGAFERESAE